MAIGRKRVRKSKKPLIRRIPRDEAASTNPRGGPSAWSGLKTLYRDEYCDLIIAEGRRGGSDVDFAIACGVIRATMYAWAKKHERFGDALTYARELSQNYWEKYGRRNLQNRRDFCEKTWSRIMACQFRKDWSERVTIDGDAVKDPIIKVERVIVRGGSK